MKDVHFCLGFVHDPGTFHARRKIVKPEDVKGLKVRPANATIGNLVTALGGANIQASAPGARDMLERGVADAITFPWGSTMLFGIDKVVKYHLDVPLYVTTFAWVMNKAKYAALSPAQRKVIDDHCTTAWAQKVAGPWADFEAAGRTKLRTAAGHEIDALTPEQVMMWRNATQPLQAQWASNARKSGVDPDEALAALKAVLAKYKAAY